MSSYQEYKDIGFEVNPFKNPTCPYDKMTADMLPFPNGEPDLIIRTPDIERYCNTEKEAKDIIDSWIIEHGSYEFYSKMQMRKFGIPF